MDVTEAFLLGVTPQLDEAYDIVKQNSSGRIWLIGGYVYKTITSVLYKLPKPDVDLDFIVEKETNIFVLPDGWEKKDSRFGNPKFVNGNKEIDYVPLNNIFSIKKRKLWPNINNFISGVPLTVQGIVYDFSEKKIIGERGIRAIQKKIIEINNLYFAEYAAKKKGLSLKEMMQEKANSLGFRVILK
jgi:hypothetical protein